MTKEKTINGVKFTAAPLTAVEGLKLKAFMLRTFGPALGEILGSFGSLIKDSDVNAEKINETPVDGQSIARAIERLMMNLDEDQFISLLRRLLAKD